MFILVLIGLPVAEVFAFIEVGHAIGWLSALVLLLGTSVLGLPILSAQARSAIERVSVAVSQRGAPARAATDGALGVLGGALLVVPGFVTDALGVLFLLPPSRALARRWISHRYAGRVVRFAAAAGRFAPGERGATAAGRSAPGQRGRRPADVESTAVEDDLQELDG
jgi:UPF0716 protein FxsA